MIRMRRRQFLGALAAGATTLLVPGGSARGNEGPIRVGALLPLSGAAGSYGPGMARAAQATAAYINDHGGILGGRPLEILVEDTESNPTAGVNAARKLMDTDEVSALIGVWNSSVAMPLKPLVIERGMLLMVSGSADQITEGDTRGLIWRFQAKSSMWGEVIARAMLEAGHRRVAVLGLENPFTTSMVTPFQEEIRSHGGEVVASTYYNPQQASYRAEVQEIFSQQPDAIFLPALLPDFTAIAKEVYRSGFETPMYTLSIAGDSEGDFLEAVGPEVAEGINHLQPTPRRDSEAYRLFLELMEAPDDALFLFASAVFDEVAVLALAMERAGSTRPRAVADRVAEVANPPGELVSDPVAALQRVREGEAVDFRGAGSDVDFNRQGDLAGRQFTHYRWRDGRNERVNVVE